MKKILAVATLCLFPVSAMAAEGDAGVDGFFSLAAGYNWSDMGGIIKPEGLNLNVRGSVAVPVKGNYGVQVDADVTRSVYDLNIVSSNLKKTESALAVHTYWRDSSRGLVGLIGQVNTTANSIGMLSNTRYFVGAEGQYYLKNVTLYGQAVYQTGKFGMGSTIDADGVTLAGQVRYFAKPNLSFTLKGSYEKLNTKMSLDHSGWLVGGKGEYRYAKLPISTFVEVDYRGGKFTVPGSSFKEHETRAMAGVKFHFGSKSLLERDRSGASLDPVRPLEAPLPLGFID